MKVKTCNQENLSHLFTKVQKRKKPVEGQNLRVHTKIRGKTLGSRVIISCKSRRVSSLNIPFYGILMSPNCRAEPGTELCVSTSAFVILAI